jgi:hypothetical protein
MVRRIEVDEDGAILDGHHRQRIADESRHRLPAHGAARYG